VRFRAPRIYQPASGNASGNGERDHGRFRQLPATKSASRSETTTTAANSSSTRAELFDYLGGGGRAWRNGGRYAGNIYVAGSTTSANFPLNTQYPNNRPTSRLLMERKIFSFGDQSDAAAAVHTRATTCLCDLFGRFGTDSLAGLAVITCKAFMLPARPIRPTFLSASTAARMAWLPRFNRLLPSPAHTDFLANSPSRTAQQRGIRLAYSTYLSGTNAAANAVD